MSFLTDVPPEIVSSLQRYVNEGVPTGGFLRAVLENNLMEAFARADSTNTVAMHAIVAYVYSELPRSAWGDRERIDTWISHHGMSGYGEYLKAKAARERGEDDDE